MVIALVAGAAGLGVSVAGYLISASDFFRAYLVAWCFAMGLSLGSLALLMIQYLLGGNWGLVSRRLLEAASSPIILLVLGLLFLPLLLGLPTLYPWANDAEIKADEHGILESRQLYMNVPAFVGRYGIYFAIWIVLALVFRWWSTQEDKTTDPGKLKGLNDWMQRLSAAGLVIYALTMTFAGIDWGMSVNKHWYSTMYPVLFSFGPLLSALTLTIITLVLLKPRTRLGALANHNILSDLGSMMLAFTMMWAYLSFSQFLLVWSANLRGEAPYYTDRLMTPEAAENLQRVIQGDIAYYQLHTFGGFGWVGALLVVGHFLIPFLLLLIKDVRHSPRMLVGIATWLLVMRFVDYYWTISPSLTGGEMRPGMLWLDLASFVGLTGVVVGVFLWQLQQQPIIAEHDPRLATVEGQHHG